MCSPNCSCISCTVAFGQQLANLLHAWTAVSWKVGRNTKDVLYDIEASTSALSQLQVILKNDKESQFKIFKPAGLEEIETLTLKCYLIFQAVILLFQRAAERKKKEDAEDESDNDSDDSGSHASSEAEKDKKAKSADDEASEDTKSELLIGPVPSLTSSKTFGLIGLLRGQWDWLENRIDHCQTQLKWIRKGLMLHLQMGRLTALANKGSTIEEGTFDTQVVFRITVLQLWKSQAKIVKAKARKEERAEESARRLRELRDKEDTASVHSSSSDASDRTVVVEENRETEKTSADEVTETKAGDETTKTLPVKVVQGEILSVVISKPPNIVTPALPASELLTKSDGFQETKGKTGSKLTSGMAEIRDSLSETMAEWTQKIFGRQDEFSKDWESQELEAWVIQSSAPFSAPIKVPYGHQRLRYGLKRTRSKKISPVGSTSFTRYISSGPRAHLLLDELTREANRLQSRERIVLAHSEHVRETANGEMLFIIAFFSICKEKAPISFTDCIGRKMTLPFETCRTWDGISSNIAEAFRRIPVIGSYVMQQHYDLTNGKGEYIPQGLWENTIKPGDRITMTMLPAGDHVLRGGFYGAGPPYGTPLRQASEMHARSTRAERLRQLNRYGEGLPLASRRPMPPMVGCMGGAPPPMFGRPPIMGRPCVMRVPPPPSSVSSVDEDEMTEAEKKELTFVSFVEVSKRIKGMDAAGFLAKCTELQDISHLNDDWETPSGSDSDSDGSEGSSSTGSRSIEDD